MRKQTALNTLWLQMADREHRALVTIHKWIQLSRKLRPTTVIKHTEHWAGSQRHRPYCPPTVLHLVLPVIIAVEITKCSLLTATKISDKTDCNATSPTTLEPLDHEHKPAQIEIKWCALTIAACSPRCCSQRGGGCASPRSSCTRTSQAKHHRSKPPK